MQAAEISAIRIANVADLLAHTYRTALDSVVKQIAIKRLHPLACWQLVVDYHYYAPLGAGKFGIDHIAVRGCENRLAARAVAASVERPMFAKAVIFAKFKLRKPSVAVLLRGNCLAGAYGIRKMIGDLEFGR